MIDEWNQADGWTAHLHPMLYEMPELLASICDDEWTFEDEVCADELGACAIHMEWQEPFDVYLHPPTEQQDQKGGKHGTQQTE